VQSTPDFIFPWRLYPLLPFDLNSNFFVARVPRAPDLRLGLLPLSGTCSNSTHYPHPNKRLNSHFNFGLLKPLAPDS
jgi:hypothetical protein